LTTKKKNELKCDLCGYTTEHPQVLGSHKARIHGIIGSSEAALKRRKLAAKRGVDKPSTPRNHDPQQCPHCEFVAKWKGGLTKHLNSAHSDVAASPTPAPGDALKCPQCPFTTTNRAGYSWHLRAQHGIVHSFKKYPKNKKEKSLVKRATQAITLNGHVEEGQDHSHANGHAQPRADVIPEATLALALGRFQEFSARFAFEHDLPARTFTAGLARLIYATTLR
jgi:uncharacterized C2H2 Zn-finger protein